MKLAEEIFRKADRAVPIMGTADANRWNIVVPMAIRLLCDRVEYLEHELAELRKRVEIRS